MYEDYMRNLLGIQMNSYQNTYRQMGRNNDFCRVQQQSTYDYVSRYPLQNTSNDDLESLYPDIYKIVYPMVRKACMENTRPLSKEVIDEITQDIYNNIEVGNIINLNINVDNSRGVEITKKEDNSTNDDKFENRQSEINNIERVENRQFNRALNDLIRILVLREFLGRHGHFRPNHHRLDFFEFM